MTETSAGTKDFYGWKNVVLLFFIYMSTLGVVFYGYSVIFPAMIKALEWNRGTASIAQTISVLLLGTIIPLVAYSINKNGVRKTMTFGIGLLFIGLLLLGTITNQMWQWIVLWGLVVGIGFGFCGTVPIQTLLMHWFNAKRATAIGLVMTGAAAGGFMAQPFFTWLMGMVQSWKIAWLVGAGFALVAMVCSFFLVNKPEDLEQFSDGLSPEKILAAQKAKGGGPRTFRASTPWEVKEVFRTPVIYFITIFVIGQLMSLFMMTSHGYLHFIGKNFTQMQSASILSFIILGSGCARFPAGWLGDRIEPRWILTVTMGFMAVAFFGLWTSTKMPLMLISGAIYGVCYGSQLIMFPAIIGNYYGPAAFPGINGIIGPVMIIFAAAVPVGAGYLYEINKNYDISFTILIIMLAVAFVFSFFMVPPKKLVLAATP
jgi:MFS family permease